MKINLKNSLLLSLALISGTSQANFLSNNQKIAAATLFTAAVSLGIWLCRDDSRPSNKPSLDNSKWNIVEDEKTCFDGLENLSPVNSRMPEDQVVDIVIDGSYQQQPVVNRVLTPVVSRQSSSTPALLQEDQVVDIDIDGSYQQQPVVNRVLTPVVPQEDQVVSIRDRSPFAYYDANQLIGYPESSVDSDSESSVDSYFPIRRKCLSENRRNKMIRTLFNDPYDSEEDRFLDNQIVEWKKDGTLPKDYEIITSYGQLQPVF